MTSRGSSGPSRRPSRAEVDRVLRRAAEWAEARGDIAAVALVGSWARADARDDSDVDLVVLTERAAGEWVDELVPEAQLVRRAEWGAVSERRLQLPSGLEIEIGVAQPSWATTDPLDPGTLRVVRDGLRAVYDPSGLLEELASASR